MVYLLKRPNGNIRGSATPGYSASQKRYRMGNHCLKPTVQPFSGPFLSVECFLCIRAPHRRDMLNIGSYKGFIGSFFDFLIFSSDISFNIA